MKVKTLIILSLVSILGCTSSSISFEEETPSYKVWTDDMIIMDEDFEAIPPTGAEKVANLGKGIYLNHNCSLSDPKFKLVTVMIKDRSWKLPKEAWESPERFEISNKWNVFYYDYLEIEVRKLRKELLAGEHHIKRIEDLSLLTDECHERLAERWEPFVAKISPYLFDERMFDKIQEGIQNELDNLADYDLSSNTLEDQMVIN